MVHSFYQQGWRRFSHLDFEKRNLVKNKFYTFGL